MAWPTDPLPATVEFWDGTQWVDITAYVYARDRGITISRGIPDEASSADPGRCSFQLNNRDGRFSPRNPSGPYYGLIGRNTPVRVRIDEDFIAADDRVRFVGEVSEWPVSWDRSGNDAWVDVAAQGILRRLGQGKSPVRSPLRRWFDGQTSPAPKAYWPLEDESTAARAQSGVGGSPLTYVGTGVVPGVTAAGGVPAGATTATDTVGGTGSVAATGLRGAVDFDTTASGELVIDAWLSADPLIDGLRGEADGGTVSYGSQAALLDELQIDVFGDPGGIGISVYVADSSTADTFNATLTSTILDGQPHHVRIVLVESGADLDVEVHVDGTLVDSGTLTGLGLPLFANVDVPRIALWSNSSAVTDGPDLYATFSHFALWDDATAPSPYEAGTGYLGETAAARANRLCGEAGVTFALVGTAADTMQMGAQSGAGTFFDTFTETWTTDLALAYETRSELGLSFRTRASLYNQAAALTLDYESAGEVAELEPTDDDRNVRNDIEVKQKRTDASARAVLETGALSVQDPPDGVGRYDEQTTVNVATESDLTHMATWLRHVGTWDETRYRRIGIDLAALAQHGQTALVAAAAGLDVGDRVVITNPPAWLPPDDIDVLALGFDEEITYPKGWTIATVGPPYGPYNLGEYQDTDAAGDVPRYDTEWSKLCTGLQLPGTSGNYASTPDNAALDITGDIDIRVECTLQSYASGSVQVLLSKVAAAPNRSYALRVTATGFLQLLWSADGTNDLTALSTVVIPAEPGERIALRAVLDVDNGAAGRTITFSTAETLAGGFTTLGAAVVQAVGTTSIASTSAPVEVGSRNGGTTELATGVVHEALVYNGIGGSGGTEAANPAFDAQATGTTSFADTPGRTWTVNGTAAIFGPLITGTHTSMLVATRVPPLWTTSPPGGFPILVKLSGAVLSVSGITGSSPIQTFTISTTVANGVAKSINGGADLRVSRPPHFGL